MTIPRSGVFRASLSIVLIGLIGGGAWFQLSDRYQAIAEAASDFPLSFAGVPSDRTPEVYRGSFAHRSTDEMLAALSVSLNPEDKVYAFPDPALGLGSEVRVYRAQQVAIKDGRQSKLIGTWSPTVREALAERGIEVADKDVVQPGLDAAITVGSEPFSIAITRVSEVELTVKKAVDFTVTYKDDADLEKGTEQVEVAGEKGELTSTYLVHREDGVEVSRKLTSQKTTKPAVAKVVRRGTKVTTYGSGQASWYGGVPALTAAHKTLPKGTQVKVVNTSNGKSVVVTIADRGPFVAGRVIDLSQDAFALIAPLGSGVASVRLEKVY